MNSKLSKLMLLTSRINRQHLQLLVAILALVLMVLGIGAPSDGGGPTRIRF